LWLLLDEAAPFWLCTPTMLLSCCCTCWSHVGSPPCSARNFICAYSSAVHDQLFLPYTEKAGTKGRLSCYQGPSMLK
jgi:hypothetical protein